MEYRFERPPRWDPARPERPAVVYLDQWCWDQLKSVAKPAVGMPLVSVIAARHVPAISGSPVRAAA